MTAGPKTVAQLESEIGSGLMRRGHRLRWRVPALANRIGQQADERPEHVAQMVRALMAQEDR